MGKYLILLIILSSCGPNAHLHLDLGSNQVMTTLRSRGLLWGKDGPYQEQLRKEIRDTMQQTCEAF